MQEKNTSRGSANPRVGGVITSTKLPRPTARDVAARFIQLEREKDPAAEIDMVKIHILCYYAQAHHLAITNTPLFDDTIIAAASGPWIPSLAGLIRITRQGRRADAPATALKTSGGAL